MGKFKHKPIDLGYTDLETETNKSGRLYTSPSGTKYPSITTVLGHLTKNSILEWRQRVGEETANRISRQACIQGTTVHETVEKYLNNEPDVITRETPYNIKQLFNALKVPLDENVGEVLLQEAPLYSDHLGVAGRVDLIAEWNGKVSCIDFKTSRRVKTRDMIHTYFMQGAAYAIMVEERTGIPVSLVVIAMCVEGQKDGLVFIEKRDDWVPQLRDAIENYRKDAVFGNV